MLSSSLKHLNFERIKLELCINLVETNLNYFIWLDFFKTPTVIEIRKNCVLKYAKTNKYNA